MPSEEGAAHFRVSPQILGPLGMEQLRDPGLAILELIKNSWDADATEVGVQIPLIAPNSITVTDNGTGMNKQDFEQYWLVLGETHKRRVPFTPRERPVIGEKGLGRLACFALGSRIRITSRREPLPAFTAEVDWDAIMNSGSLDAVPVTIEPANHIAGTTIEITRVKRDWKDSDTDLLESHVEFLAVPRRSDRFVVNLQVGDVKRVLATRPDVLDQLAEAELEVEIEPDGAPKVKKATVGLESYAKVVFRGFSPQKKDPRLAGSRIRLLFFRRDVQLRKAKDILTRNQVKELLEKYEGVRIFRDDINVPPYGLEGNDWAKLEKQRTATGGPTMVPGNSQLIGEVHISRQMNPHLAIMAGRAGFTDQEAVTNLAEYVRWAVKCVGTVRRAAHFEITEGRVPSRVDEKELKETETNAVDDFRKLLEEISSQLPTLSPKIARELLAKGKAVLKQYEVELRAARIYAQLATTGASAASFAHELRKDFDIVDDAMKDLEQIAPQLSGFVEEFELVQASWAHIRGFVGLFKLVPIKVRRNSQTLGRRELEESLATLISGIPHAGILVTPTVVVQSLSIVPAELDSIILNLYTNAVKAIRDSDNRDSGAIEIRLHSQESDLVVDVLDNGCGVSPEVAEVMWEPIEGAFPEGTGMGLPITMFLAGLYSGQVTWRDQPEAGMRTMFRVTLRGVCF